MELIRLMILLSLSLSPLFFTAIAHPESDHHDCGEEKCSPDGPAVRFPFQLVRNGKKSDYCGFNSSYNLHCDAHNRTILQLTSSAKVVIADISYSSQTIIIQSYECCFGQQLKDLDTPLSLTSPFRYVLESTKIEQILLFNCSYNPMAPMDSSYSYFGDLDCLGSNEYRVNAIPASTILKGSASEFLSCVRMHDISFFPLYMMNGSFGRWSMNLSWSEPNCGSCEKRGGICGWEKRITGQIGCSGRNKSIKPENGILKILHISGPIIGCFLLLPAIGAIFFLHTKWEEQKENQLKIKTFLEDYATMKPTRYSYADLKKITGDFKHKLGEGAYGNVFKGRILNKIYVAVKLLHNSTGNGEDYVNEVAAIGRIHHINVVRLLGFCADGYKRALVFEYLPNGSLDKFIFPDGQENHALEMRKLKNIAIGIARGIEYLHQGCQQQILHFDIKPHNILLDDKYNPKISDFGLAKLCEKGKSAVSMTAARGTMGYIAPEVFSRQFGNVSYKSDIYSFGMLLLEMVGRRKNIDATVENISQVYFPEWIYERLANGEEFRIQIGEDGEEEIAKRLAMVGLWCIQWKPVDRPAITSVLHMLEGNGDSLSLPSNPFAQNNVMNVANSSELRSPFNTALAVISESE